MRPTPKPSGLLNASCGLTATSPWVAGLRLLLALGNVATEWSPRANFSTLLARPVVGKTICKCRSAVCARPSGRSDQHHSGRGIVSRRARRRRRRTVSAAVPRRRRVQAAAKGPHCASGAPDQSPQGTAALVTGGSGCRRCVLCLSAQAGHRPWVAGRHGKSVGRKRRRTRLAGSWTAARGVGSSPVSDPAILPKACGEGAPTSRGRVRGVWAIDRTGRGWRRGLAACWLLDKWEHR